MSNDLAALEKKYDAKLEELEAQNAELRAQLSGRGTSTAELAAGIGEAFLQADEARRERVKTRAQAAMERRLAATKRPFIFRGRLVTVPHRSAIDGIKRTTDGRADVGVTFDLRDARRGETLRFDPADGEGERVFHYGQTIYLSERDHKALSRTGYLLQDPGAKIEVDDNDHIGGAYKALEEEDYNEAVRILRAENAMPHDDEGKVVKTKPEVMQALGEWIDEQKG